jgi:hypothetical protein
MGGRAAHRIGSTEWFDLQGTLHPADPSTRRTQETEEEHRRRMSGDRRNTDIAALTREQLLALREMLDEERSALKIHDYLRRGEIRLTHAAIDFHVTGQAAFFAERDRKAAEKSERAQRRAAQKRAAVVATSDDPVSEQRPVRRAPRRIKTVSPSGDVL